MYEDATKLEKMGKEKNTICPICLQNRQGYSVARRVKTREARIEFLTSLIDNQRNNRKFSVLFSLILLLVEKEIVLGGVIGPDVFDGFVDFAVVLKFG